MIIDSPIISGSYAASGSLNQHGNVVITGSLTVTGTINGSITGSITTASYALNAETLDGLDSTSFTTTSSFNTVSGSFSTRVTNLESFSSSLDSTFATDAQLTAVSQSFSSSLSTVSGSLASRVANNEATGSSLTTASSSFSTRTTNLETASGSFSTRVTNNESNISSLQTASGSFSTKTTNLETASGSFSTRTTNLETASGSFSTRVTSAEGSVTSLNSKTGSYATTGSNTFVNTQYISAANNAISFTSTASLYTDGGLRVTKDMYVSGTSYFNNVTIFGTQSVQYITSSQLNIGTNIITVNTDTPTIRFGGLAVYDSGSTGLTGSMLWDSEDNQWIYSNPSGSAYDSAVFLVGPRNSGVLGNEPGISCNFLSKGNGMHHMTSSGIFEDGTTTCFYSNASITSAGAACFASCVTSLSNNFIATTDAYTTQGTVSYNDARGLILRAKTATVYDFSVYSAAENAMIVNPTGTNTISFLSGNVGVGTLSPDAFSRGYSGKILGVSSAGQSAIELNSATGNGAYIDMGVNGTRYFGIYSDSVSSDISTIGAYPLTLSTNTIPRLLFSSTGIACFACQVCAKSLTIATDCSGVVVDVANRHGFMKYVNFSTGLVGACSGTDSNIATWLGRFAGTIFAPTAVYQDLVVNGSGNVGIGATSPTNKLEVDGGSSAVALRISTTNTSNGTAALILANSSKAAFNDGVKIAHGGGFTNITDLCNTNIMTWDMSNTRVGIGTVSPIRKLDIVTTGEQLRLAYDTSGTVYTDFRNDSAGGLLINTSGGYIVNYIGGSAKMRINPDSICFACQVCTPRLHINTPDGCGLTLQYGANSGYAGVSTDSANSLIFKAYIGNEYMRIRCDGNVGINCTSPNRALTVNGCIGMPNTYNWSVANDNDINWGFRVCSSSGNFATFLSYADDAGSDRRGGIFNTGGHWVAYGNCRGHFVVTCNLGVGTGTPRTRAEFSSGLPTSIPTYTNKTNGIVVTDGGAIYGRIGVSNFSGVSAGYPTYIQAGDFDGASYYNLLLNPLGGNVGIGTTSPAYKLDVNGSFNLGSNAYINYSASYPYTITVANTAGVGDIVLNAGAGSSGYESKINLQGGTSGYLQFSTISTERMRITNAGRVGIGLTSPTAFLHVCGNNCGADISCGGGNPDARGIIHAQLSNSAQSLNASVTVENDAGIGQFMQWTSFGMRIGSRIIKSTNCGHLHFTVGNDSNTVTFHCGGQACFANHICVGGNIVPISNGSQDLGSSSLRWCTVYTSDLSLNNGIGNYTIVEGESDLFLYNNNSCKVFKFMLQEVCPEIAPAKRSI
jgi:hypothetical protein